MDPTIIIALIGGGGIAAAWAALRKAGPESESINVATMRVVIEELRQETNRLGEQVAHLRDENENLRELLERKDGNETD